MKTFLISLIVFFTIIPLAQADTVTMVNGKIIQGKYMGGTEQTVQFKIDDEIVVYQVKEILSITFLPDFSSLAQQKLSAKGRQTPQPEQKPIIPPHTRIPVRIMDTVDTIISRKDDWFAATLETALSVDGKVIVPKGTKLRGQIIQSEQGKYGSALVITLRELILNQKTIPITTTNYTMWDKTQGASDSKVFNTPTRSRLLQIPAKTFLVFKTMEPVEIDVAK